MSIERVLLAGVATVFVYLLGYYQITPTYLYSLTGKTSPIVQQSAQSPVVKPSQARIVVSPPNSAVTAIAQPTPWPAPAEYAEGQR